MSWLSRESSTAQQLGHKPPKPDEAFPAHATDTISALRWSPTANHLAAACWDGKVRVFDVADGATTIRSAAMLSADAPVLSCDFSKDGAIVAAGGADKKVHLLDASSASTISFEAHAAPVRAVRFVNVPGAASPILATGSWDKTLRYWDVRQTSQPVCSVTLNERVYSMDSAGELLAIATADPTAVHLINLRTNPAAIADTSPSKLRYQARFVSVSSEGKHWAVGGIEGRCSAASVDPKEAKTYDFSWKCHREAQSATKKDPIKVFTVNDGCYHPVQRNVFATGGTDGEINFWDVVNHNRLKRLSNVGLVTALAFSREGTYLAYATGYDWSKGYLGNSVEKHPPKLMLHHVSQGELRKA